MLKSTVYFIKNIFNRNFSKEGGDREEKKLCCSGVSSKAVEDPTYRVVRQLVYLERQPFLGGYGL